MKRELLIAATSTFLVLALSAQRAAAAPSNSSSAPADASVIAVGERLFDQHCSGCHNFRQDGIGPRLGEVTREVPEDRLRRFIADPQGAISSGDERAARLFEKYKVVMPSFASLGEGEVNALIAYLQSQQSALPKKDERHDEITNPIPEPIRFSGLTVDLKPVVTMPVSSTEGKLPLTRITKIDTAPHTADPFILDLRGKLYRLTHGKPVVYMDIARLKPNFINEPGLATGFGSFAFHPDFARNGLLYTVHTEAPGSSKADFGYDDSMKVTLQAVVTEWKTKTPKAKTFSGEGRELFRVNMVSGIHGIQEIVFNPHAKKGDADYGMLYIGVGDGGAVENGYPFLPHNKERVWGTVLRIDPSGRNNANGKYGVPPDNPFVGQGKALGEIYAYGFRNPHRITWTAAGQMLVSNVGQAYIESLNLIQPGADYGWPLREGNFALEPEGDINKVYPLPKDDSGFTYPVAEFDHDEGKAITGGYEYVGKKIPALKGKFLFGDIPTGRLFYVDVKDLKQGQHATIHEWKITINGQPVSLAEHFARNRVDLRFGRDARDELYVMTKTDGRIYRMNSAKVVTPKN